MAEFWPEDSAFLGDVLTFWEWVDPGGNPYRFWTVRHAIDALATQHSRAGKAALKLALQVLEWARAHRPSPMQVVEVINAREQRTEAPGSRRFLDPRLTPGKPVRLYHVWSLDVSIRKVLGEGGSTDPEILCAELALSWRWTAGV